MYELGYKVRGIDWVLIQAYWTQEDAIAARDRHKANGHYAKKQLLIKTPKGEFVYD